jgi:hypothetical protein
MELPDKRDDDGYDVLGSYSPPEAERFLDALEKAEIEYRAEENDKTPEMTPIRSRLGGAFGQAVQVLINMLSTSREAVGEIHEKLFGDCLPNYDFAFFREQGLRNTSNADECDRSS